MVFTANEENEYEPRGAKSWQQWSRLGIIRACRANRVIIASSLRMYMLGKLHSNNNPLVIVTSYIAW